MQLHEIPLSYHNRPGVDRMSKFNVCRLPSPCYPQNLSHDCGRNSGRFGFPHLFEFGSHESSPSLPRCGVFKMQLTGSPPKKRLPKISRKITPTYIPRVIISTILDLTIGLETSVLKKTPWEKGGEWNCYIILTNPKKNPTYQKRNAEMTHLAKGIWHTQSKTLSQ